MLAFLPVGAGGCENDDQAENTGKNAEDDREQIDKWIAHSTHCEVQACREEADTDDGDCCADPGEVSALVRQMLLCISQLVFFFAVRLPGQVLDLLRPSGRYFLLVYPKRMCSN